MVSLGPAPLRLDGFLRKLHSHLSLSQLRAAVEAGKVLVNGKRGNKGQALFPGDVVSFTASSLWQERSPMPNSELQVGILYEDEELLVVDKPAGMACHGFSGSDTQTLANFLMARCPSLDRVGKSRWEPGLVHRLDRDTSGLVLVAKNQAAYENLRAQFRCQLVKKSYSGLVWGRTPDEEVISHSLTHDPKDRRKMVVISGPDKSKFPGKQWEAATRFQTLARSDPVSFIDIEIYTGVTHQIRAHLESAGYPLVGDRLYAGNTPDGTWPIGRHFLHARSLELFHPGSGSNVTFESPLPADLLDFLGRLGVYRLKQRCP